MSPLMIALSCMILTSHNVSHSTLPAHIAAGDADRFLGTWTAVLAGPAGPVDFRIAISADRGRVVASVSSDLMSDGKSQEITKLKEGIALHYTAEL